MQPDQVRLELLHIADKLDRSKKPSVASVAAEILRVASALGPPEDPGPTASGSGVLGIIGDVDYVTHGGAVVHDDGTVDLIEPPEGDEDSPDARWTVYRFMADNVDPAKEWFGKDLAAVAQSMGTDPVELSKMFQSDDIMERASAYMDVVGYHGAQNFDSDPLVLTKAEIDARFPN